MFPVQLSHERVLPTGGGDVYKAESFRGCRREVDGKACLPVV